MRCLSTNSGKGKQEVQTSCSFCTMMVRDCTRLLLCCPALTPPPPTFAIPSPAPVCPQTLLLPTQWQSEVDMQSVVVRSKPFSDAEELQPICYRCSTTNPLLNTQVRTGTGPGKA